MLAGAAACLGWSTSTPDGVAWHRDRAEPARLRRIDGIWITEVERPAEGIRLAVALQRDTSRRRAALLFHYSLLYLALLFVALAADAVA